VSVATIAGLPTPAWCTFDKLTAFGDAWKERDGAFVCSAPGIYVVDGVVRCVLPRCYRDVDPPQGTGAVRATLSLLRVMGRYRLRGKQRAVVGASAEAAIREIGGTDDALGRLEVALLLVDDFSRSGPIYITTSDISPRRQGRIHWPKTQRHGFHAVSGAEVMTSPLWRSRRGVDPEDALTMLHVDTCASIRAQLGMGVTVGRVWSSAEALSVLDQRERGLYADRHRLVARWLRQYWGGAIGVLSARRSELAAQWSPAFPLVWETMLREVVRGRSFSMPTGTYRLVSGAQGGLHLIPDFVIDRAGTRLIVDAKHYDLSSMPGTESIAKQLLYRWFASHESGHGDVAMDEIISVFALPAVGRHKTVDVLGTHRLDGEEDDERDAFGRVIVVAVDYETVAHAYGAWRCIPALLQDVVAPIKGGARASTTHVDG